MLNTFFTIFFIIGFAVLVMLIRRLFDSEKGIQKSWEGATRHLCALAAALIGMVVLFTLLQLLDLFEGDLFTLAGFLSILQVSFILSVGIALVIVTVTFLAWRRDT